jgi:DeoR/GlpR family transcriptional regulator of sugar metabolism
VHSEQRRRTILELLNANGSVSVSELGSRFDVSEMTRRRDLDELERKGLLTRVHGGAISARRRSRAPALLIRCAMQQAEKQRIAKAAVGLISNGDSIALDIGSTTYEIARQMSEQRERQNLTVITPSLRIANQLVEMRGLRLFVTGGLLRPEELSMVGKMAEDAFKRFFVDKLFLGVSGIDFDAGLTDFDVEDALVKQVMLPSAKEIIVVADASKFNRVTFAVIAPLTVATCIITDASVDPAMVDQLRAKNIDVIVV